MVDELSDLKLDSVGDMSSKEAKAVDKLKASYAKEAARKQSRRVIVISTTTTSVVHRPPSSSSSSSSSSLSSKSKRSSSNNVFSEVSGGKGRLMRKAKREFLKSLEVSNLKALKKNAIQKSYCRLPPPVATTIFSSASASRHATAAW